MITLDDEWDDSCDDAFDRESCDRCCGEGFVEYFDAPDVWEEDCPNLKNHLVKCPDCNGKGVMP